MNQSGVVYDLVIEDLVCSPHVLGQDYYPVEEESAESLVKDKFFELNIHRLLAEVRSHFQDFFRRQLLKL